MVITVVAIAHLYILHMSYDSMSVVGLIPRVHEAVKSASHLMLTSVRRYQVLMERLMADTDNRWERDRDRTAHVMTMA
jgi:hypothetical protein